MEYTTILASKPGTPVPKLDKRTDDNKIFMIDCLPILCDKELVRGIVLNGTTPLTITELYAKEGRYIKFRVGGGPTTVPYTDYLINFTVRTSKTNDITVPVTIRVFSN